MTAPGIANNLLDDSPATAGIQRGTDKHEGGCMTSSRQFFAWGIVTFLVSAIILCQATPGFSQAENDNDSCYECHKKMYTSEGYKPYIHLPYMKKDCLLCHQPVEGGKGAAAAGVVFPEDLQWLGEGSADIGTHVFMVPVSEMNDTLFVEARHDGEIISRFKFFVPYLSSLRDEKTSGSPPVISDVKVLEIKRELFISATIGWKTDTYSSSVVRYGTRGLDYKSEPVSSFTKEHRITLPALKAKTNYFFSVFSRDLNGNEQESEQFSFSTADLIASNTSQNSTGVSADSLEVNEAFNSYGDDTYIIKLTANQPVILKIGSLPGPRKAARGGTSLEHTPVIDQVATAMGRCNRCHGNYKDVSSHPVNVRPKPGRIIPPEYPTLRNGKITCMSCHSKHASIFEFRLIKPSKQELCIGCHPEYLARR